MVIISAQNVYKKVTIMSIQPIHLIQEQRHMDKLAAEFLDLAVVPEEAEGTIASAGFTDTDNMQKDMNDLVRGDLFKMQTDMNIL